MYNYAQLTSVGTRALAKAFIYLASERPELTRAFREVVLVAPDLESDIFRQEVAPGLDGGRDDQRVVPGKPALGR